MDAECPRGVLVISSHAALSGRQREGEFAALSGDGQAVLRQGKIVRHKYAGQCDHAVQLRSVQVSVAGMVVIAAVA